MATTTPASEIHIAIVGAGVTSLCLAKGLLAHNKKLRVTIFEARPELGNDGSGFGIGPNAQRALGLVHLDLPACLETAGSVTTPELRLMLGTGPQAGEEVVSVELEPPIKTVRRSRLLQELQNLLPADCIKFGARLASVEPAASGTDPVTLTFENGDEVTADAIIGCDGLNSIIRQSVLGPSPASGAHWSTGFNTRIMISRSSAVSIFGSEYCDRRAQTGWIGDGGLCLTDLEDDGDAMQVIASFDEGGAVPEVYAKPFVEVPKAFWTSRLSRWGVLGEKISEVVEAEEKVFAVSMKYHGETPSYINGRLCLAGDAANTFPPFRGSGAGQGIEDALVLVQVLGQLSHRDDVIAAFRIYNDIRHPRREAIAKASWQAGDLLTGKEGLKKETLVEKTANWNDWIHNHDVGKDAENALSLMLDALHKQ